MTTLAHQTRIAVQIIIVDDTGSLTYILALATGIFAWLVAAAQAVDFTARVFSIGLKSLAFGFGLSL